MAVFFVKALLAGSLLYLCSTLGDASLASVSSAVGSVVDNTLKAHGVQNAITSYRQARFKREVTTKTLDDPKGCLDQCQQNETQQLTSAVLKNTARLVALALEDLKGDETKTPAKEAAFKKRIEEKTIANMGPMFEDLCKVHKTSGLCFSKCPDSQARSIMVVDNEGSQVALCEPTRNWNNFSEYWAALNCTNATEVEKPCDSKCGPDQSIANVTSLEVGEDYDFGDEEGDEEEKKTPEGVKVKYETDAKKNTGAANKVCKSISCQTDCYKPIMTKKCGAKAYDMYYRMSKVEPHTSLTVLKTLSAVNQADDCKQYL